MRLALIHGCQNAAAQYAEAARRVRGLEITAIVQPNETTRQEAANLLGVTRQAATLPELLDRHAADFDAVLIRGPVAKRAELACQAAQAGKQVCVTSPAAIHAEEVSQMSTACQSAGVTLMTASRRRFQPSVAAVKSALDSGQLGQAALLRVHHWIPRESLGSDRADVAGRRSAGPVWAELVNHLELAIWMFGRKPTELFVQSRAAKIEPAGWPDSIQVHLGFPEGGMSLLSLAQDLPPGDGYDDLVLIGSTGAAYADDHAQRQLLFRGESPRTLLGADDIPTRTAQLRCFLDAVAAGRSVGVADAEAALSLAETAWNSLAERRPIAIPETHHAG